MLPHSSELLKEVEALKVENEALKAQLSKELDELKQENYTLKQKLRRLELQHKNTAGPELQTNQSPTNQSQTNQSSIRTISSEEVQGQELTDDQVKTFNCVPDNLRFLCSNGR